MTELNLLNLCWYCGLEDAQIIHRGGIWIKSDIFTKARHHMVCIDKYQQRDVYDNVQFIYNYLEHYS
jgi:hypothetical protein